jgi:dienelactone hydrolase
MNRFLAVLLAAVAFALPAVAEPLRLAPYKDDLFAYPSILESQFGGDYLRIEYIKARDLWQRDEIPERRARTRYVSLKIRRVQDEVSYKAGDRTLKAVAVGRQAGARIVVIYLHGKGGSREQGADDWMFGGNFNRIKNLMAEAGGLYLSPDFTDFDDKGAADIKALVKATAAASPGAPIFLACGSMGGRICWAVARDAEAVAPVTGMLLLGSMHDDGFLKSAFIRGKGRKLPLYLGHGTYDTVFDWQGEADFYKRLKAAAPDYPARLVLFETGTHGTPIRMTDWRLTLNWMLEKAGR